jgi:hypothetical protein
MASDFKFYSATDVECVGVPIAIVSTDQPVGTNVLRVEWYLFVRSHTDAMTRQGSGTISTTMQEAAVADPIGAALGFIKSAFMAHQAQLQVKTGWLGKAQEVEFAEIDRKIFANWTRRTGKALAHPQLRVTISRMVDEARVENDELI